LHLGDGDSIEADVIGATSKVNKDKYADEEG
jgi:hypothetical protein